MKITSQISPSQRNSWSLELKTQFYLWCAEVQHEHWEEDADIFERHPQVRSFPQHAFIFPILHGKAIIITHVEYQLSRVFVLSVKPLEEWHKVAEETEK